jgi:hypothetical protein
MRNKLNAIGYRIAGIAGCLLDLFIQVCLSAASMFRKDPEWDDTEKYHHE